MFTIKDRIAKTFHDVDVTLTAKQVSEAFDCAESTAQKALSELASTDLLARFENTGKDGADQFTWHAHGDCCHV